ncbi:MAG TPA: ATP-binding cassette domain-containing protein, partial [Lacibacter sp.]|nr:ATP-binding cassette domain-containing protein [Lacibacter sp.]
MLTCKQITKRYGSLEVLKGVDLQISKGEIVSLVGSSGAGKSTLLHILGTLDEADGGQVWLNNVQVNQLKGDELAGFRNRHIGFVFQFHHLLPEFTALENVCIPGWLGAKKKKEVETRAIELL